MRRAARRDENHVQVGDYLRALGWSVLDLADLGDGCPDYAVSKPSFASLLEIKNPNRPKSKQKLTPDQERVRKNWQGPYVVATSGEDAAVQLLCLLNGWEK